MLLNEVMATNSRGDVLNLPLEDPSSGFVVKNIDGLDPVKATLVSSSFANEDGEQFHSSRRDARNIKLQLGLDPDYAVASVKDLRDALYNFFMPKRQTLLMFKMYDRFAPNVLLENLDLNILGVVESFESPLFTKDPVADISLMCFDPDFYDPNLVTVSADSSGAFNLIELDYAGSTTTGAVITATISRAVSELTFYYSTDFGVTKSIDISYPFAVDDILTINSNPGSKAVTLTRAGVVSSILYAVSPQSGWYELSPGYNDHLLYVPGAPAIPYTIQYNNKYGGL